MRSFRAICLILSLLGLQQLTNAAEKPNIILIMTDDVGMEWFGAYGNTEGKTPHLDKLAAEGIFFNHCYSQPICTPSRVKIMTGRYAFRNYKGFEHLPQGEITFGHLLKDAGYSTAVAGKWQLAGYPSKNESGGKGMTPEQAGFDEHCNWSLSGKGNRYARPNIETNGDLKTYEGGYGPEVMSDFVLDFITRKKDQPFFVYYPMVLPHSPHVPTPDSTNPNNKNIQENFRDMIEYTDKIVGKIVAHLESLKLSDNTIILFTSDNGTASSITTEMPQGLYKGGKGSMTNRGTHVPLIVQFPGVTPRGVATDDLVDFSDFLPTLADIAGVALPQDREIDGVSFWPQLQGQQGTPRDWVFCNYWYQGRTKAGERQWIRNQRFKLYNDGSFFDVQNDWHEENPIPADGGLELEQTQRKKLQMAMDAIAPKIDDSFDFSKKKQYEQRYRDELQAAIERHRSDPAVQALVTAIEEGKA